MYICMNFWAGSSASYLSFIVQRGVQFDTLLHNQASEPYQNMADIFTMYDCPWKVKRLKSN